MFQRRHSLTLSQKFKEALMPSMGWQRAMKYFHLRTMRAPHSNYKITAGLASGVAASFSPLIGTHILQAALLGYVLRASVMASLLGTIFGNPWTFPFTLYAGYKTGTIVLSWFGVTGFTELPDDITLSYLFNHPKQLLFPLMVGGYICAALAWPVAYVIMYYPVKRARRAFRYRRLLERRRRRTVRKS